MKPGFQPRRIIVMKLRHIGDVLLTTPVFDALRAAFPRAALAACVNAGTEQLLTGNPLVSNTFTVPKSGAGWAAQWKVVKELRQAQPDLLLDFTGSDRSAVLARLSGAGERWGYHRVKGFWGRNQLFTQTARRKKDAHVVEQQADLLEQFGIPSPSPRLSYTPREEDRKSVAALLPAASAFVHVHPVSRLMAKTWPVEFMAQMLDHLAGRGLWPVVTASPDPVEMDWTAQLARHMRKRWLNLSGQLTLPQLGALSEKASVFLGVDSAPLHLAAAVGTPVIGIFGPSSEQLWGPWCERKLILSRDLECRLPCKLKSACPHIACLREMKPDMVIPEVDQFLRSLPL